MNPETVKPIAKILPLRKLCDMVEKGTGRLFKSFFTKKDADAKAYEMKAIAQAQVDSAKILIEGMKDNGFPVNTVDIKAGKVQISTSKAPLQINHNELPDATLQQRSQQRLDYQDAQRQLNVESIVAIAAEQLSEEAEIDDKPIDEDWTNRFFRIAEDISSEELQMLWARILANEVKNPKTFSLRTLELIKNLSSDEANLIQQIGNYAFSMHGQMAVFHANRDLLTDYGINFKKISLLIEIGILQSGFTTFLRVHAHPQYKIPIYYGNYIMVIEQPSQSGPSMPTELQLPVHFFTTAGTEILKLINPEINFHYFHRIAQSLNQPGVLLKYKDLDDLAFDIDDESQYIKFDFSIHE